MTDDNVRAFQAKSPAMTMQQQVIDTLLACRAMPDSVVYTTGTMVYILTSYTIAMNLLLGTRGWLPEAFRAKVDAALIAAKWMTKPEDQ